MMPAIQKISLFLMATVYILAGINHFINPIFYKRIMPVWLPAHNLLILVSGIFEVVLGILLLPSPTRKIAAWGIIVFLLAVFPANIQMMWNYYNQQNTYLWLAILRLPLQIVLIWWAYSLTKNK